jgi:putative transposase
MSTNYPSNLSYTGWECLQRYLPPVSRRGKPPIHPLRTIFDAIFSVLRDFLPMALLARELSPWQTVFYHFRRLRLKGTWFRLLTALREAERERVGRNVQPSAAIMHAASASRLSRNLPGCVVSMRIHA